MTTLLIDLTSDPTTAEVLAERFPSPVEAMRLEEIQALGPWRTFRKLRRGSFHHCAVLVSEFRTPSRWLSMVLMALLPRAAERTLVDRRGEERAVSWGGFLGAELPFALARARMSRRVRREALRRVRRLAPAGPLCPVVPRSTAFVRSDLGPKLVAGGSLAHLRGVIEGFRRAGAGGLLVSPAPIHGFDGEGRATHVVPPDERSRVSVEIPHLAYNAVALPRLLEILQEANCDLVYQRHALGAHAGAEAAQTLGLPFVLEFNGSEVWIAEHWGAAREHMAVFAEIERRVLGAADLVVAVSEPLRSQLHDLGVGDERILINPNGVDADRFDAARLAGARAAMRDRLGIRPDELVVTFVGTFGPWHGAEVLARAAPLVPDATASRLRYLFIGDGPARPRTEAIVRTAGLGARSRFMGLVPQDETPDLLAASDLCVSPHVPNADGSPFFGSPTKLFEYMASGRAIVASRIGQIGEVLEHGRNAWLVPPGDPSSLAESLTALASDPVLRERLGAAAAADARQRHTWDAHVARILERLAVPAGALAAIPS